MAPILTGSRFGFGSGGGGAGAGIVLGDWTRIINLAGAFPGDTTGSFPTAGYNELLIFGVAGGGGGGAGGDDDGGGGGGGGAGQVTGYWIPQATFTPGPYSYVIPGGGAPATTRGQPGGDSPNLTVSSPSGLVFSLNGGSGAVSTPGNPTGNFRGAGGAPNSYSSHQGGNGHVYAGRVVNNSSGSGLPGAYGGSGGGGSGIWAGSDPPNGSPGRNNTLPPQSVSTFEGTSLTTTFTCSVGPGSGGTGGFAGGADGDPVAPAFGGNSGTYNGGGGAGAGIIFFGTGNRGYGAGGGGGHAQSSVPVSGRGGAGYLVVYAR